MRRRDIKESMNHPLSLFVFRSRMLGVAIAFFASSLLFSPFAAFAQMGPCSDTGTCPSGQICFNPPEGGQQCFKLCEPAPSSDPFADTGCPSGQSCGPNGAGQNICISLAGSTGDFTHVDTSSAGTAATSPAATTETTRPFESITPKLGVEIPGLTLSPATKEGDVVRVPFLAEYINGVYRYAIAIVLVASIVMVVWGGFRYLFGSSYGNIERGKEIIRDALAGMLIVLGAYVILQAVNPATLDLSVLRLSFVTEQDVILRTTTADTSGTDGVQTADPPPQSQYTSCPVNLTTPPENPPEGADTAREREFSEKMQRILTGTRTEKVLSTAEAAVECGLALGACGRSAESINKIAGVTDNNFHGRRINGVGSDGIHYLQELTRNCRVNDDTADCKRAARQSAADQFRNTVDGWPNSFTDGLQPGDFINVFTVWTSARSPDGAGQHSAIFLGWVGNGRARLFNGSWGNNVRYSTYCITDDCSNMYPITNVWRPQ